MIEAAERNNRLLSIAENYPPGRFRTIGAVSLGDERNRRALLGFVSHAKPE